MFLKNYFLNMIIIIIFNILYILLILIRKSEYEYDK